VPQWQQIARSSVPEEKTSHTGRCQSSQPLLGDGTPDPLYQTTEFKRYLGVPFHPDRRRRVCLRRCTYGKQRSCLAAFARHQ
jgi:hypothetical protein